MAAMVEPSHDEPSLGGIGRSTRHSEEDSSRRPAVVGPPREESPPDSSAGQSLGHVGGDGWRRRGGGSMTVVGTKEEGRWRRLVLEQVDGKGVTLFVSRGGKGREAVG
ncbi:hypothetical protein E2562_027846 [Oryza meyeriana var. granulata]|uniref:Uncharacterized protein n=1 Tax=Oryza meyeriana var. granulata TaxID=110450 RepID=A0A6G1DP52_9ORYZ|nr:hypothetical protein E2562_027846 [Oryza meyeriana var. granulata]